MPSPKPVESAPRDASWNRVVDVIGELPNSWNAFEPFVMRVARAYSCASTGCTHSAR